MDTEQKYTLKNKIKNGSTIFFLVGPTAVGKTEVAIELAKMINAEIISCDSMQVYKGIDIISQKVTRRQRKEILHHMIDIISPSKNFNAADYRKKALKIIKQIHKKGKTPLVVGGTAFYMKALIDGLFPSAKPDLELRERLKKEAEVKAEAEEKDYLYKKLQTTDPETAKIIHPNDAKRIIRALEVCIKNNAPMSELKKKTKGLTNDYDVKIFCLNRPREELYDRINKRTEKMFKAGAIAECARLKNKRLSLTASQILGCKEIFTYLDKKCTKTEAIENLKQNTRRFAKRQLSWFRNDERIKWVEVSDNKTAKEIAERLNEIISNGV